jgi:hypothetical protein
MFLKNDRIVVTLGGSGGVRITSHRDQNLASQFNFDPTAFSGWTDGVSVRRSDAPRPTGHGDYVEKATLASRLVTLQGIAYADASYALHVMRDRLMGIFSDGQYSSIAVQYGDVRYATVGLEGSPSWVPTTDTSANWKLDLYAPDPFIYGEEQMVQTGANVSKGGLSFPLSYPLDFQIIGNDTAQTVTNRGNAKAWPKFRVVGDYYSGFTVSDNLGNKITYNGIVTKQSPVVIDMQTGVALQNGVDKSTMLSDRGWFAIPPYSTIQPTFTPIQNGSGWCEVIFRDTWI